MNRRKEDKDRGTEEILVARTVDPRIAERIHRLLLGSPVARALGIEMHALEADRAVLDLPFKPECDGRGYRAWRCRRGAHRRCRYCGRAFGRFLRDAAWQRDERAQHQLSRTREERLAASRGHRAASRTAAGGDRCLCLGGARRGREGIAHGRAILKARSRRRCHCWRIAAA